MSLKRDWGYAPDYVEGMWLMLQQDEPDDYVLATGETFSIRDFLELAFREVGITEWEPYVVEDPRFMRPAEVDVLRGNASKAKTCLGWEPKTDLQEMVKRMVAADFRKIECDIMSEFKKRLVEKYVEFNNGNGGAYFMFCSDSDWCQNLIPQDEVKTVVELGSRDGLDAIWLHKHFNAEVVCWECHPELVHVVKEHIQFFLK